MNPQRTLKIDRWLGRPICWALTVVRRLGWLFTGGERAPAPQPPRKILFIKMIEQGATVLAYRALASAAEMVGRENVYFWVFQENRPILDLLNVIPPENVLAIRTHNPLRFVFDTLRTLWRVRRLGIDATVDMEFYARAPAILAFLTGARRRVGLHRFTSEAPYRGDLLTHRVQYNPYLHTAEAYCLLVEALRCDPRHRPLPRDPLPALDLTPPAFMPGEDEQQVVRQMIRDLMPQSAAQGPVVLLNSNASDLLPLRKWPQERFVELAHRLLASDPTLTIVLAGGKSETAAAQDLLRRIDSPRAVSLAGRTTLRQLLVLYTLADVLVTNDSGPGHFASMTRIDTVVLFGPETPALFGPLGDHTHVLWAHLPCSPCVSVLNHRFSPCSENRCMQAISTDQVYEAVVNLLRPRRETPQLALSIPEHVKTA